MRMRNAPKPAPEPTPDAVLFDTYSVLFRAFHALPRMNTSQGLPTSALYGFSALVLKVLRERRPRTFAFAVDAPKRTFRHERYDGYKAGRAKAPSDLVVQLERLPELLDAFQVPVFCAPGFEADDVLATLARRLSESEQSVLIVSGDRDMLQLVNERTHVLFIGGRGQEATLFDVEKVWARFGLSPDQLPSWVALAGDASDNLEGVPGVGARTATSLIVEHGSVGGLLANLERVAAPALRQAIADAADRLRMNEELARLRCDLDLGTGASTGSLSGEAMTRIRTVFEDLEFKSLIGRLEKLQLAP